MGTVSKDGQTEPNILESGEKIELMEKVNSFTLMETFMMVFGQTTRLMDMVLTNMSTGLSMKESGRTIFSTDRGSKLGPTRAGTRESTPLGASTESALTTGTTGRNTLGTGLRTKLMASVFTVG